MAEGLDIGFFEPFRNNVISIDGDIFTIRIRNAINFDKDIIEKYFDEAIVNYNRNEPFAGYKVTFTCKPKTNQIREILTSMFYNISIKL